MGLRLLFFVFSIFFFIFCRWDVAGLEEGEGEGEEEASCFSSLP